MILKVLSAQLELENLKIVMKISSKALNGSIGVNIILLISLILQLLATSTLSIPSLQSINLKQHGVNRNYISNDFIHFHRGSILLF